MRKHVLVPSGAVTLVTMLIVLGAPAGLQGQTPSREDVAGGGPQGVPALVRCGDGVLESGDRQEAGGGHREGL